MLATETPKASRTPTTEMGTKEAEEITATIKNGFENLGTKLLEARERKAYKALGYKSFESYCLTEFGKSASSAYRIIENQKVIDELEAEVARQYNELISLKITGPQVQLLKKLPEVGSRLQAIEFAQKLAKSEERNPTTKHLELAVNRFSNKPEHYRDAIQDIFSQGVRVEVLNTPKTSRGTVRKSEKPSTPLNDSIASKGDRVVLFAKGLEGRQGEIYTYKTGKKALVVLDGVTLPIDVAYAELELVKETSNTNSDTDKSWDENLVWESGKNIYYYFPDDDKIYSNRWPTGLTLTPCSHSGTPAEFVKNWEERFAGQVVESLVKDSDLNSLLIAQLISLPEQEKESFVSNLFKSLAQFLPTNHTKLESAVDTAAEVEIEKLRRQNQELQEQLVEAESVIVEMVELCRSQRQELQEQLVEAESVIVEMVESCRSQRQELQEQLVEVESVIVEMVELCRSQQIELIEPQNLDNPPRDTAAHTELLAEDNWRSVLEANHFCSIEPDDRGEFIEEYRNWNIFFCSPNGEIIAIDLMRTNSFEEIFGYCTEEKWHVPLNKFEEALSFNETLAWTKTVINQVEDFCPGQLSLALETATLETNPQPIELFPTPRDTAAPTDLTDSKAIGERDRQLKILEKIELTHRRIKLTEKDLKSAHKIADKKKLKQEITRLGQRVEDLSFFATLRIGQKICHRLDNSQGQIFALCFSDGGMPHAGIEWEIEGRKSRIYEPMHDLTRRITGLDIRE